MNKEKMIVALLLVAILLSVVTLSITLSSDDVPVANDSTENVELGTANVVLDIVPNPAKGSIS